MSAYLSEAVAPTGQPTRAWRLESCQALPHPPRLLAAACQVLLHAQAELSARRLHCCAALAAESVRMKKMATNASIPPPLCASALASSLFLLPLPFFAFALRFRGPRSI